VMQELGVSPPSSPPLPTEDRSGLPLNPQASHSAAQPSRSPAARSDSASNHSRHRSGLLHHKGAAGRKPSRYEPKMLRVKTTGWSGTGSEDAPGTDMLVEVGLVRTVGELKELLTRRREAWSDPQAGPLRLLYNGHLMEDDEPVDESWCSSFAVAMESRPRNTAEEVTELLRRKLHEQYARVIDLFRKMDVDRSGTISEAELSRALLELGVEDVLPEQVGALFKSFDVDGGGRVDYAELLKVLR